MADELILLPSNKAGPYLYIALYERLLSRAQLNRFVILADVNYVLGSFFRVPKANRCRVMVDMKLYGFLKKASPKGWWLA